MLGIRLPADAEEQLSRHAGEIGRGKSVIAREWILERLQRETVDAEMREAAKLIAAATTRAELDDLDRECDEFLKMLNEEDGGYDWGPAGPPV